MHVAQDNSKAPCNTTGMDGVKSSTWKRGKVSQFLLTDSPWTADCETDWCFIITILQRQIKRR